jgi:hypothetical protein
MHDGFSEIGYGDCRSLLEISKFAFKELEETDVVLLQLLKAW